MSKINAIRFININYNSNMNRISDESLYLNGENTLIVMDNGVGKTVMVQLLTALFVGKKYRKVKNRPFESYFTTSKPSFIMVEWALDGKAGYVLTGMMVRQSQHVEDETDNGLDMINFVAEYRQQCNFDIHHLPVVNQIGGELTLNSYSSSKKLFEDLKRENRGCFSFFDMNNYAQSRQYFQRLREYGIEQKEWQSIIREVNKDESGLSQLFEECRNEKELVEKWFLPVVEEKLNNTGNKIQEFKDITEKYILSYYKNNENIKRKENILYFQQQAQNIRESAKKLAEAEDKEAQQLFLLQGFYAEMESCRKTMESEICRLQAKITGLDAAILRLDKEEISAEYYELEKKLMACTHQLKGYQANLIEIQNHLKIWSRRQHIQECADKQKQVDDEYRTIIELENRREVLYQQEKDTRPELDYLGYRLKLYYKEKIENIQKHIDEQQGNIASFTDEIRRLENIGQNSQSTLDKLNQISGQLKAKREYYAKEEVRYNNQYATHFQRNIMGVYDDGMMKIMAGDLADKAVVLAKELSAAAKAIEENEENIQGYSRELQEACTKQQKNQYKLQDNQKQQKYLDEQLELRRCILKYIDLEEKDVYNLELLYDRLTEKAHSIQMEIRRSEMAVEAIKHELHVLETGRNIELGENLQKLFSNLDIEIVQGMEWLKHNGHVQSYNAELVRKLPFLPYALLMTQGEFQRLQLAKRDREVYTSFPIPIVLREELADDDYHSPVADLPFYMLFNEELLDSNKLQNMQAALHQRLNIKMEEIGQRRREYDKYSEHILNLKNQTLTHELMEQVCAQREELCKNQESIGKQIIELQQSLAEAKKKRPQLAKLQKQKENEKEKLGQQEKDLALLSKSYEEYLEVLQEAEANTAAILQHQQTIQKSQAKIQQCRDSQKWAEEKLFAARGDYNAASQESASYQSYKPVEKPESARELSENVDCIRARYDALNQACKGELQDINAQIERAQIKADAVEKRLQSMAAEYDLCKEDWLNVAYNDEDLQEARQRVKACQQDKEIQQEKCHQADKMASKLQEKKSYAIDRLQRECRVSQPLPLEEVKPRDYAGEKKLVQHEKRKALAALDNSKQKLESYERILDAMIDFKIESRKLDSMAWPEFANMSHEALREYYGDLKNSYELQQKLVRKCGENVKYYIQKVIRDEKLSGDFFQKQLLPLENVVQHGINVLKQLDLIFYAYETILHKLELDLAKVEQERTNLADLLLDYVRNVHEELGKMDKNSSIRIRDKFIKMLRIELSSWDEEADYYRGMMEAVLKELTLKGLELLEHQQPLTGLLGQEITTRNLYEQIVGIRNIDIHLYKIEHDRELKISWRDVAKNSGGEGFLSAFVILSSLLYYMRRDDTDIFADRNEGKVLLMDNPFAKTYSAHLLRPLMEVAKKNNTQLVCLTGLGGDAIYDRFDNIYMLKLVNRSLSNIRYLSSQHVNGNEPKVMEVDHFQVADGAKEIWLF